MYQMQHAKEMASMSQDAWKKRMAQSTQDWQTSALKDISATNASHEAQIRQEVESLLREREECEEELAAFKQLQECRWPAELAAVEAKQRESVTEEYHRALLESASREDNFRETLQLVEAKREEASLSAHQLSARS